VAYLDDLHSALIKADAAGDSAGAKALADEIRAQTPQESAVKQESSLGQKIKGAGEAALSVATGIPASIVGGASGIARNLVSGTLGTPEGTRIASERAKEVAGGLTYSPRTEEGKAYLSDIGNLFDKSKLAGLGPTESVDLASIPRMKGPLVMESDAGMTKRVSGELKRAQIDQGVSQAKEAGYSLPLSQVNPSLANQAIEGVAGKIKTAQKLAEKDQFNSNRLLREHYGVPEEVPMNQQTLSQIRADAGKAYEAVRNSGRVTAGEDYFKKLDEIAAPYKSAAKDFPESARTDITDAVNAVKQGSFDASSAVDQIRLLRGKADAAFAKGDKALGRSYKDISGALEDELGRHLERTGANPNLIQDYQAARRTIAETYTVQKHLQADGNIDAIGLARELKKGAPLQGNIRTIAEFGQQFPKVARLPEKAGGTPLSLFDFAIGGGASALMHNPYYLAAAAGRPAVRAGITSGPYQKYMVNPPGTGPSSMISLGNMAAQAGQQALPGIPLSGILARPTQDSGIPLQDIRKFEPGMNGVRG
jgi:hypothetical protein